MMAVTHDGNSWEEGRDGKGGENRQGDSWHSSDRTDW